MTENCIGLNGLEKIHARLFEQNLGINEEKSASTS